MKALLYKEFKLAMHPICYVFILLFPLMIFIPSDHYPIGVSFIYLLSCYPILFLGANKGQQSNDLLFSTLLPVRKKDIVLARVITVIIMQVAFMGLMAILAPIAKMVNVNISTEASGKGMPTFGYDGFVSVLAVAIVGFAVADLIFFPLYYRNGKSIVMSTLFTILGFAIYIISATIGLPAVPEIKHIMVESGIGIQFAFLAGAIALSAGLHYLAYRISYKKLELVDF